MVDYDRLALTEAEQREIALLKRTCPFRDWYVVKVIHQEACNFDSKRKAMNYARKHYSADYEQVRIYHAEI